MDRWGWAPEFWLLVMAATTTVLLVDGTLLDLDWAVHDWVAAHQWPPLHLLARSLNFAGSANVLAAVAVLLAAPTVWRLRSPAAAALVTRPIVLAFLLSYALVGPIKLWTDRAAPTYPSWNAAELFTHADGWSFPSGHVVNAIIWYRVLLFLLDTALRAHGRPPLGARPRRVLRLAPPTAVCCTVTYLNYHWLTDSVVAVLLGLFLQRLLNRFDHGRRWSAPGAARPSAHARPPVPV
jgi:hypothetical protein